MGILDKVRNFLGVDPEKRKRKGAYAQFPGVATQFETYKDEGAEQQLVIGLDLGTAYTKVVIGEPRIHYAVPMAGSTKTPSYIASSSFYLDENGAASLTNPITDAQYCTDLKMPLLLGNASVDDQARIALFMALCLRRARHWLMTEHKKTYKKQQLEWLLHVGIPTDSYQNKELNKTYWRMANIAWALSVIPGSLKLDQARGLLLAGDGFKAMLLSLKVAETEMLHPELINLFPEFLAQIAGYVRSPRKQQDLHMVVDIGAGTMDSTVFNVIESDGEGKYPIFARSVTEHGTHFLINHRLKGSAEKLNLTPLDLDPVPKAKAFAKHIGIDMKELDVIDRPFHKDTYAAIGDRLRDTKTKMYKKSRRWDPGQKVPLFLAGGGSHVDFYQEVLRHFESKDSLKIDVQALPKPEILNAKGLSEGDYGRLSVAYGLSFDPDDLGDTFDSDPEDEVLGKGLSGGGWRDNYIDQSMM